jgi:hypothetical protein
MATHLALLTLTFHAGTVADVKKVGGDWIVQSVNTTDIVVSIDDLNNDGTISNDEWDAAIGGNGNDTGSAGYLFDRSGNTGFLYSTNGLTTFTAGDDVDTTISGLSNSFESDVSEVICFTPGTLIATPFGDKPVEQLRAGDLALTADNGLQTIRWVGRKRITGARLHAKPHLRPIKIRKGAFGNDIPTQDMWLSPQHRMHMQSGQLELLFGENEVLAPAKSLVDDHRILVDDSIKSVDYIHILFDRHELVFANGALSESFYPGLTALMAMDEAAQAEVAEIFPDLAQSLRAFGQQVRPNLKPFEAEVLAQKPKKTAA